MKERKEKVATVKIFLSGNTSTTMVIPREMARYVGLTGDDYVKLMVQPDGSILVKKQKVVD